MSYEDIDRFLEVSNLTKTPSSTDGFADPRGVYPKKEYQNQVSTNQAARGAKKNKLYTGGGDKRLNLDLKPLPPSRYPLNQVRETVSGHITEIDDTPGSERMLFRHRTGAGIELRPDGTVIISSTNNTIRVTGGDEKVIIEGDGHIIYNGNLTLNVSGDFDVNVGGDYNLKVAGDKVEQIDGSTKERIEKNSESTVVKNRAVYTTGSVASTTLGNTNIITKGDFNNYVGQKMTNFVGQDLTLTTQDSIVITSKKTSISASKLAVLGDSGTIGGDEIVLYSKTGHIDRVNSTSLHGTAMYATTFHGDLNGAATEAGRAGTAGALGASGSAGTTDNTTGTNKTTVRPDNTVITDYLNRSSNGIRKVSIDPNDSMKNQIDRSTETGGVSTRKLSTAEVRSKLRDPKTLANKQFVGAMVSQGVLNSNFVLAIPEETGRTVNNAPTIGRNTRTLGNSGPSRSKGFIRT